MILNTQELIDTLSGKNKGFITRVSRKQLEKYGNEDVFGAIIYDKHVNDYFGKIKIEMQFGDYWIEFTFDDNGKVIDTYGNGQGHKYHKSLQSCAEELFRKVNQL